MDKIGKFFNAVIEFCKAALILIILIPLAYCVFSGESDEEKAARELQRKQAYVAVQNAKSAADNISILQYIQSLMLISQQGGNRIEVEGWAAQKAGEEFHVWFYVNENGEKNTFHWTIKPNGRLEGVDKTTRQIAPDQVIDVAGLF